MKQNRVSMWVHPNFRKKLKMAAAFEDMPILEFTKNAAEREVIRFENKKKMLRFPF